MFMFQLRKYLERISRKFILQYTSLIYNLKFTDTEFIQSVPLATKPDISLIILTPMKILQRNLNRSTFVVWEMKRNVSVVCVKFRFNILIIGKIIKEMLDSVASGTLYSFRKTC